MQMKAQKRPTERSGSDCISGFWDHPGYRQKHKIRGKMEKQNGRRKNRCQLWVHCFSLLEIVRVGEFGK